LAVPEQAGDGGGGVMGTLSPMARLRAVSRGTGNDGKPEQLFSEIEPEQNGDQNGAGNVSPHDEPSRVYGHGTPPENVITNGL
jgi:hypothetical protein